MPYLNEAKLVGGPNGGEYMPVGFGASEISTAVWTPAPYWSEAISDEYLPMPQAQIHYYRYNGRTEGGIRLFEWVDPNANKVADLQSQLKDSEANLEVAEERLSILRSEMKELLSAAYLLIEHHHYDSAFELIGAHLELFE